MSSSDYVLRLILRPRGLVSFHFIEMALVFHIASFLLPVKSLVSPLTNIARAWYRAEWMGYSLPARMLAPSHNTAHTGRLLSV